MNNQLDNLRVHIFVWHRRGFSFIFNNFLSFKGSYRSYCGPHNVGSFGTSNALNPFQYKQIFKRYRKAGKSRDIQLYRRSEYFLIMSNGIFYRPVIEDLESQIAWIYAHKVESNKVPVLSSDDRRTWAKNLQELTKCK